MTSHSHVKCDKGETLLALREGVNEFFDEPWEVVGLESLRLLNYKRVPFFCP